MNDLAMTVVLIGCLSSLAGAATDLDLPPRPEGARGGLELARAVVDLSQQEREARILAEWEKGNVPRFLRTLVPVTVTNAKTRATYGVTPDYLAIGSDDDYFLTPLTPATAQRIADRLGCVLPTPKMVDDIFAAAPVKLTPAPIPPSPAMTTVPVFIKHNARIRAQRAGAGRPLGALVAGHKKDVVIANRLFARPGSVAIYGWHQPDGKPIQPLYTGHVASWVDYSHGIRLVRRRMTVNGAPTTVEAVLADPDLAPLLSREGVMEQSRYRDKVVDPPGETTEEFRLDSGVRVVVNRPTARLDRPILLVLYALPNGGTIEQAVGKAIAAGEDWRFEIQHLGAQTRFLREQIKDRTLVVAYLENDLKSWPAWRKTHGDDSIPAIVDAVRSRCPAPETRLVLSGHSGGGSFVFGYLNRWDSIPDEIERIAFLDANYAYETKLHRDKFAAWLKASDRHFLCVLAYDDAFALLNGKSFVSAAGGTWGRSRLMRDDLGRSFPIATVSKDGLHRSTSLGGRLTFLLRENPERKILHTLQVERNGFIESLLSGTALEEAGYTYFGPRAYSRFIND